CRVRVATGSAVATPSGSRLAFGTTLMSHTPTPPLTRTPGRRGRCTFRPNYLSFAGTYQCNLTCAHCCVPIEWPDRLPIDVALRFLEDCADHGIRTLGFTGGEPFLYADFLKALCRQAVELGFRFDKIMTNGVWFDNVAH